MWIKKNTPHSSRLYDIAVNYKAWIINHLHENSQCSGFICKNDSVRVCQYDIFARQLVLSGDIELNPGPTGIFTGQDIVCFNNSDYILRYRLLTYDRIILRDL